MTNKVKNLLNLLNSLCEKLDNNYMINNGGCCYVAYLLAKELEDLNIPYKFITRDGTYHCTIEVEGKLINPIDEEDDINAYDDDKSDYMSEDILEFYENESWNDTYSRKWNLIVKTIIHSKIKRFIDENSRK